MSTAESARAEAAWKRAGMARLARPGGGFAMVAIDQREALRGMLGRGSSALVDDARLTAFKLDVVQDLSPLASAVLVDRLYALEPVLAAGALAPRCALVVAADELLGEVGAAANDSRLDEGLDPHRVRQLGAVALKLLVMHRPDDDPEVRREMVREFRARCRAARLLAIVEGVARPPREPGAAWDREAAVLAAAQELGGLAPDLYKAELPLHGRGDPGDIRRRCEALTEALPCPWVVLSSGVEAEDFPAAVRLACQAGASGFLAGRAIWGDAAGRSDWRTFLTDVSTARLATLAELVDAHARPWFAT